MMFLDGRYTMLELYMIRHGLAGEKKEDETTDDERPLKKKWKEKMKDIAKGLKELRISFDIVLTSPLLRAKESAEIVNAYCCDTKEVTVTDLLVPDASYNNLIKFLNKIKNVKRIAIVGHEPFLSSFASYCLSKNENSLMNLKKGGILMLEIDEVIRPGRCILSWLIEPKQIIKKKSIK
jgi:phosphohistidine phosphatase